MSITSIIISACSLWLQLPFQFFRCLFSSIIFLLRLQGKFVGGFCAIFGLLELHHCLQLSKSFSAFAMILLQSFSQLLQASSHRGALFREVNWCLLRFFTAAILSAIIARQGNPNPSSLVLDCTYV